MRKFVVVNFFSKDSSGKRRTLFAEKATKSKSN